MLFNPIKDQSLSSEVEEWLKNNKPTVIPRGVSTATGYTLPAPSERSEKESAKHRAEINRLVRQQKKAEKLAAKEAEAKIIRLEKIKRTAEAHAQVIELINEFRSKMGYGDLGRLAKKIGVCTETITNWTFGRAKANEAMLEKLKEAVAGFEYNHREKQTREVTLQKRRVRERKQREKKPDVVRKRTLASAKKEAIEQGVKKFSGPCKVHGMTEYRIVGDRARCVECERDKQKRKYEQMHENLKKMKYCLKYGKKSFTGTCDTHGESKFYINKSGQNWVYRCDLCRKDARQRQREAQQLTDAQRYRRLNREMALTMYAADPNNRTFLGMCLKHGETEFYIKVEKRLASGVAYACKKCKRDSNI